MFLFSLFTWPRLRGLVPGGLRSKLGQSPLICNGVSQLLSPV